MAVDQDSKRADDVVAAFCDVLPPEAVIRDAHQRRISASDIAFDCVDLPACVLLPSSEAEVTALVQMARSQAVGLYPRGGGWSYTAAHVPQAVRSAIVDTSRMDGIALREAEGIEVGAGVTWDRVEDTLKPLGLRVPSFGPLSGIGAQVGGSVANDGAFFGGAGHGAFGERSVAAVTMVDGHGQLCRLTEADRYDPVLAPQPLAGDCGAFGIKTRVVLKLMKRPEAEGFASFAFRDSDAMVQAMANLYGLPDLGEVFAFDEGMHRNLIASGFRVLEASPTTGNKSWMARVPGLNSKRAQRAELSDIPWALHISVDGNAAETEALLEEIARRVARFGGELIPDVIPRVTRAKPFRPIKALVTPMGERWLSSHGLVEAAAAPALLQKLQFVIREAKDRCAARGVRSGFLVSLIGRRITVEPQLYWPDSLSAYLLEKVTPDQAARFRDAADNLPGRELVYELRQKLIDEMDAAAAGHFQIGRTYAGRPNVPQQALASWRVLKKKFDPDGIMNPGVLDL